MKHFHSVLSDSKNTQNAEHNAWRPLKSPFERWPNLMDFSIALIAFVLTLLMWSSQSDGETNSLDMNTFTGVGAFVCAFVGNFSLLWRRSYPWQSHSIILSLTVMLYALTPAQGLVALIFSLYSLGRHERNHRASLMGVCAALAFYVVYLFLVQEPSISGTLATMLVLVVWYMGRRLRFRGEYLRLLEERADYLERERNAESERAVAAERVRISRELHDVVAHQVSLMTIQAGAARTISTADPEAATQAITAVESAGRKALTELRHLLNIMRPENDATVLGPQPGLDQLPELIHQVQDAGLTLGLNTSGDLENLPTHIQLTIYRIVQEAITNVIKHAGPTAKADVSINGQHDVITIVITDNGNGVIKKMHGGHGITGMRERVELLGGSLSAGNRTEGGFEVRAIFPRSTKEQQC